MNLEILICTIDDNIQRVEQMLLATAPHILYLISWQRTDACSTRTIPEGLRRDDVKVLTLDGKGLSRNRNNAIKNASGDICLIADDDLHYELPLLQHVVDTFQTDPALDLATFRYVSSSHTKYYPKYSFDLRKSRRYYYITSFEIAFRRSSVQGEIAFNELLGLGAPELNSGEEDIFVHDAVKVGLKCRFIPLDIACHNELTTGVGRKYEKATVMSLGAIIRIHHPKSYVIQYLISAFRSKVKNGQSFSKSLKYLIEGGRYAKVNHIG